MTADYPSHGEREGGVKEDGKVKSVLCVFHHTVSLLNALFHECYEAQDKAKSQEEHDWYS